MGSRKNKPVILDIQIIDESSSKMVDVLGNQKAPEDELLVSSRKAKIMEGRKNRNRRNWGKNK